MANTNREKENLESTKEPRSTEDSTFKSDGTNNSFHASEKNSRNREIDPTTPRPQGESGGMVGRAGRYEH